MSFGGGGGGGAGGAVTAHKHTNAAGEGGALVGDETLVNLGGQGVRIEALL